MYSVCIVYPSHCSVPANTAVYQSCVAFVFVLSVPILRERVTVVKVRECVYSVCIYSVVCIV